jgi:protoheme IX farnesyltransferase
MMRHDLTSQGTLAVARWRAADYVVLAKPELTLLSVLTSLGGAYLAAQGFVPYVAMVHTLIGTTLVGAGAGALNQYIERDADALMRRTENRPLPTGRIQAREALLFGISASILGVLQLALLTHPLAGALAAATLVTYLFLYTPLKRVTPFATIVGGLPGALPPLIGWAAVTGELPIGAWSLFFILFFWQMPHFLSLAWMYRKDYARAGYRTLTVIDPTGQAAARQILIYTLALIPAALALTLLKVLGPLYSLGALILSVGFLLQAIRLYRDRSNANARKLFYGSLVYLSILIGLMILDRTL